MHDSAVYLKSYVPLETIKAEECPQELCDPIFTGRQVIDWHRIKDFQVVSLKMLAAEVLGGTEVPPESLELLRHLQFRDALQKQAWARKAYGELKTAIAAEAQQDRKKYAEIKQHKAKDLVEKIMASA